MLWWVIQNIATASALALLVRMACFIRRIDPVARHALWLIVLIKLMTPPLIAWPWPILQGWSKDAPPRPVRVVVLRETEKPAQAPAPSSAEMTPRVAQTIRVGRAADDVGGASVQLNPAEVPAIVQSESKRPIEIDRPAEPIAAQWPA